MKAGSAHKCRKNGFMQEFLPRRGCMKRSVMVRAWDKKIALRL